MLHLKSYSRIEVAWSPLGADAQNYPQYGQTIAGALQQYRSLSEPVIRTFWRDGGALIGLADQPRKPFPTHTSVSIVRLPNKRFEACLSEVSSEVAALVPSAEARLYSGK